MEDVAGTVNAKTSGGSIYATLSEQPDGNCYLGTSGGGITVTVAEDMRLNVDAKTNGGKVSSELPLTAQGTSGKNRLEGKLNGGGPELVLRTSGASINIKQGHSLQ